MRLSVFLPFLALASALAAGPVPAASGSAGPDLAGTVPILEESFEGPLRRYDGVTGLWSTGGRTGRLMTNASEAVFLDRGILGPEADALLPDFLAVTPEGLSLRSLRLPEAVLPELRAYMARTGQGDRADRIRYGTARITTAETWSQVYGYFEIEARMPRGRGRWPAFWLTLAGPGWPPEIDVVEAYGDGLDLPTPKDGTFNTAVFFDALDAEGEPTHATDIDNPFATTEEGREPKVKMRGSREIRNFHHLVDAAALGADIYADFHVYAALWTPEHVIFYFGPDRDNLREIYRTPTPEDVHDPMFVIANDQFTARGGIFRPRPAALDRVLTPENDFLIRRITVRALRPGLTLDMGAGDDPFDARDSVILGTPGDDVIVPGAGFDIVRTGGGADEIRLSRGRAQKILEGFDADDVVELEGYPFADEADALRRLTQVGDDVWLSAGADPDWPHTVVFRDAQVADFHAGQFRVRWSVGPDIWASRADLPSRPTLDEDGDGVLTGTPPAAWLNDKGRPVRMVGTEGPDRFMIAHTASAIETPAGTGLDTVISWIPYTLPEGIRHGVVRGAGAVLQGGPGDDRLEAEGRGVTLAGGPGDDLLVVTDRAETVTIRIGPGDGHDRLRGFRDGVTLAPAPVLRLEGPPRVEPGPGGALVHLAPDQSLLIEGLDAAAARRALGLP
ncbi:glycoside hydrolase family 16 protein [Roseivivax isoporae]|uniref:GH16 domain-containing protein n=1 Tax=Roseivivax isoporae LMG 25204 TaxID=1449351 RepID=X7F562_9RHOB|nr:family 16 glycosylhydrolase [Roseivivax isoporae]ETX27236.1 hypothetical protein RISW2_15050 [Roseivivax isoporae LMG 25204]